MFTALSQSNPIQSNTGIGFRRTNIIVDNVPRVKVENCAEIMQGMKGIAPGYTLACHVISSGFFYVFR